MSVKEYFTQSGLRIAAISRGITTFARDESGAMTAQNLMFSVLLCTLFAGVASQYLPSNSLSGTKSIGSVEIVWQGVNQKVFSRFAG